MRRTTHIRVGYKFRNFAEELRKELPKGVKRTDVLDGLAIELEKSGVDKQAKRLIRRRYGL